MNTARLTTSAIGDLPTDRESGEYRRSLSAALQTKAAAVQAMRFDVLEGDLTPRQLVALLRTLQGDLEELSGVALRLESEVTRG